MTVPRGEAIERPDLTRDGPVWLALLVAALLLAGVATPRPAQVLCLFVVAITIPVALRWRMGPFVIVVLLAVGVIMRVAFIGAGQSDVLDVTVEAGRRLLGGENPYGVGYGSSSPPGAPFAYGPLALIWYLPAPDPRHLELAVSLGILGVLALRGRPLGLAVYATLPVLLVTASDGSNDTSAGLFLLVALLAAGRSAVAGGALLALAVAFKPYALAWLPPLLAFGGLGSTLLGFGAASLATWGPILAIWGPAGILASLRMAEAVHDRPYYSLAYALGLDASARSVLEPLRYLAGIVLAALSWLFVRSPASIILWGTLIFGVTLYSGFWSTFAYLAALAPVLCWHLDDWLGMGTGRVRWPGDPVGRLTAWVDARWPLRSARSASTIITR